MALAGGVVGTGDNRGFTARDLSRWLPMEALTMILLVVLAARCNLVRRRSGGHGQEDAKRRVTQG